MKQTAVGFLKKHIENDAIALYDGFMTFTEFMDKLDGYYNKAKEMEKQQIIEAHGSKLISPKGLASEYWVNGEEYYNKTFNKGQK
jgi:hypothetical protein